LTGVLSVIIGIVIASAFQHFSFCSRIAWEGRNDFGIIFDLLLNGWLGFCFLGYLADQTSIEYVYNKFYLPLIVCIFFAQH
jgi:FSR family fosmidomycin resistance protein-like MFS transporter